MPAELDTTSADDGYTGDTPTVGGAIPRLRQVRVFRKKTAATVQAAGVQVAAVQAVAAAVVAAARPTTR